MLKGIKEINIAINEMGYYDIMVNGVTVCEMVAGFELADAIAAVMEDEYGMVADMLAENEED